MVNVRYAVGNGAPVSVIGHIGVVTVLRIYDYYKALPKQSLALAKLVLNHLHLEEALKTPMVYLPPAAAVLA